MGQNVGSFRAKILGVQGPQCGFLSAGLCLWPGAEMCGPCMGTLLGARGLNVRSFHGNSLSIPAC